MRLFVSKFGGTDSIRHTCSGMVTSAGPLAREPWLGQRLGQRADGAPGGRLGQVGVADDQPAAAGRAQPLEGDPADVPAAATAASSSTSSSSSSTANRPAAAPRTSTPGRCSASAASSASRRRR